MRKLYRVEAHIYVLATDPETALNEVCDIGLRFKDLIINSNIEPAHIRAKEIKSVEDVIASGDECDLDKNSLFRSKEEEWDLPLKHFLSPEFQMIEIIEE